VPILIWCPDHGGWHTAVRFEDSWRLHAEIERVLYPQRDGAGLKP